MKNVTIKYRRCPKCGKVICYKLIEDDGRDWMGHHWGEEKTYTVGYDCDCESSISQQDHLGDNL